MKARILFVDDEPNILQALRRALRGMREECDMIFAGSGAEAIDVLADQPFDAVVTDMRMPGMDGAELLGEVVQRQPQTIRFVLSGEADRDMTYRTVGHSHRFLPKPCDTETLIAGLRYCLKLRNAIADTDVRTAVTATASLATPPKHASFVHHLFDEEVPALDRISEAISRDPALSAKLLQLANSAYFGVGKAVDSPAQAVQLIGLDILQDLVRDHSLVAPLPVGPAEQIIIEAARESLRVAQGAAAIARQQGLSDAEVDHAYGAGLLHLVGRMILATQAAQAYLKVQNTADEKDIPLDQAEEAALGVRHADVGAYLAGLWGLPPPIVAAIAHQHAPGKAEAAALGILPALHVAKGISQGLERQESADTITAQLDADYLDASGLMADVPVWIDGCADVWAKAEAMS